MWVVRRTFPTKRPPSLTWLEGTGKQSCQGCTLLLDFPVFHPFPTHPLRLGALFPPTLKSCAPRRLSEAREESASWPCKAQVSPKWYKGKGARLPPPSFSLRPAGAELTQGCVDWGARVKGELKTPQASLTFHSHSLRACLTHA